MVAPVPVGLSSAPSHNCAHMHIQDTVGPGEKNLPPLKGLQHRERERGGGGEREREGERGGEGGRERERAR